MTRPVEVQPPLRRLEIPHRMQEAAGRIGLTELTQAEIDVRFADIVDRVGIGLRRPGKPRIVTQGPEAGMATDGGFAALESGVQMPSLDAWRNVPVGREAYVASIGGTNSKFFELKKVSDTELAKTQFAEKTYDAREDKPMTFAEYVGNIVDPIAQAYKEKTGPKGKLRVGVSLAFPHENVESPDGVDAVLLPFSENGDISKGWRVTDLDQIPPEKRGIIGAMKEEFKKRGIDVDNLEVALHDPTDKFKVAVENDTLGALEDSKTAQQAREDGLMVLRMGGIGGTGTNLAVDQNGLVNLEFGRYPLPLNETGRADQVTERALDIIHAEDLQRDPNAKRGKAEMETETGGMYMSYRLRAGIQIIGEEGHLQNARELEDWVKLESASNPTFISDLAERDDYGNDFLKFMAQGILHRAGQNFGLSVAAVSNVLHGDRSEKPPAALLVEGSFVNHATGVKNTAEAYSHIKGQPIKIYEANSIDGIGTMVMSL